MKRRGIVIPQYQEVMTPPKKEEATPTTEESNQSVNDLFNESIPSESISEPETPAVNDENGSMKF
jgi:hypothetical protein